MANPNVMIQYSVDHGHTWSHEIWKELVGDTKDYLTRVRILHRAVQCQQIMFRIRFTADAPFALISASANVEAAI